MINFYKNDKIVMKKIHNCMICFSILIFEFFLNKNLEKFNECNTKNMGGHKECEDCHIFGTLLTFFIPEPIYEYFNLLIILNIIYFNCKYN